MEKQHLKRPYSNKISDLISHDDFVLLRDIKICFFLSTLAKCLEDSHGTLGNLQTYLFWCIILQGEVTLPM